MFIQRLWIPTDVSVVTEGDDELVENKTDSGVIRIFIEEFYGSKLVERYLEIGIGMSCSLIKIGDCKPCPASIYEEFLPISISLAKSFEGVPALVTTSCRNVEIDNLEDISRDNTCLEEHIRNLS